MVFQKGQMTHNSIGLTKEFLMENYTNQQKSSLQIAREVGCNKTTILRNLNDYNIPTRTLKDAMNLPSCRAKMLNITTGQKRSDETKQLLSEVHKGIPSGRKGKKASISTIQKMQIANLGKKHPNRKRPGPHTEEHRRKIGNAHRGRARPKLRGEHSPNWKGGKSFEPYCPAFTKQLKEDIRNVFRRRCFLCGLSENGKRLHVHHCDYNKGQGCGQRWSLIPLCQSCHSKTNFNRHYYFNLLANYWALNPEITFMPFVVVNIDRRLFKSIGMENKSRKLGSF